MELDEQLVDERERFRAPQQVREKAPLHGRPEREVAVDVELERDEVVFAGGVLEPLEDVVFIASADVDGGSVNVDRSDVVCGLDSLRSGQCTNLGRRRPREAGKRADLEACFLRACFRSKVDRYCKLCTSVLARAFILCVGLSSILRTRLHGADIAFTGLKFLNDTKYHDATKPA